MSKAKSHEIWIVGAIILIAVAVMTGYVKLPTSTQSIVSQAGSSASTGVSASGGVCPTQSQALQITAFYNDFTQSPVKQTQVATSYSVYSPQFGNGASQLASGTTSATSLTAYPSSGSAGCNTPYSVLFGDNSNYLEQFLSGINTGTNVNVPASATLFKYSAPTVTVSNTIGGASPTSSVDYFYASSANTVPLTMYIQAGTNYAGNPAGEVAVFSYNSAAETINVGGASLYNGKLPSQAYVSDQNSQLAIVLPQGHYNEYITPSGAFSSSVGFSPTIQISSNFGANQQSDVGLCIYPMTGYLYNGQWNNNTIVNQAGSALVAGQCTSKLLYFSGNAIVA